MSTHELAQPGDKIPILELQQLWMDLPNIIKPKHKNEQQTIKDLMRNDLVNMQINKQLIQASEQATRHAGPSVYTMAWLHLNKTWRTANFFFRECAAAAACALTGCVYGSSNRDTISNQMAYS